MVMHIGANWQNWRLNQETGVVSDTQLAPLVKESPEVPGPEISIKFRKVTHSVP